MHYHTLTSVICKKHWNEGKTFYFAFKKAFNRALKTQEVIKWVLRNAEVNTVMAMMLGVVKSIALSRKPCIFN